jgi:cytochrome c oxidase cbb3-type subunit 2
MPAYPWLAHGRIDADDIVARMRTLRRLGDPYTDADLEAAPKLLAGKTEMDAIVAYLQGLGASPRQASTATTGGGAR